MGWMPLFLAIGVGDPSQLTLVVQRGTKTSHISFVPNTFNTDNKQHPEGVDTVKTQRRHYPRGV